MYVRKKVLGSFQKVYIDITPHSLQKIASQNGVKRWNYFVSWFFHFMFADYGANMETEFYTTSHPVGILKFCTHDERQCSNQK